MRLRTFAAFIIGWALGVVCLGVFFGFLWYRGEIVAVNLPWRRLPVASATSTTDLHQMIQQASQVPGPAAPQADRFYVPPQGSPTPLLPPAVGPKTPIPSRPAPATEGTADRTAPDVPAPHIAMPLEGVDASKLQDNFNDARDGRRHEALDIMAPRGTPVHAVADGNVEKLFTSKQGGLTVYQFDPTHSYCYYYAHLDHYAKGLQNGTFLRKGDVLGYVGTTGDAPPNAPHLHLAVFKLAPGDKWWQGTPIDPLPMLK